MPTKEERRQARALVDEQRESERLRQQVETEAAHQREQAAQQALQQALGGGQVLHYDTSTIFRGNHTVAAYEAKFASQTQHIPLNTPLEVLPSHQHQQPQSPATPTHFHEAAQTYGTAQAYPPHPPTSQAPTTSTVTAPRRSRSEAHGVVSVPASASGASDAAARSQYNRAYTTHTNTQEYASYPKDPSQTYKYKPPHTTHTNTQQNASYPENPSKTYRYD